MFLLSPPRVVVAEIFARLPDRHRRDKEPPKSQWAKQQHAGRIIPAFFEGPSFDRAGNLYTVDIAHGRIFRTTPDGEMDVVTEYDGEPNGLKIHKDGRIFIADHKHGIMTLDPGSGTVTAYCDRPRLERFIGVNDLVFARNGDIYFTDQGQTGIHDPTGRVYRLRTDGQLDRILDNVPSPNGIVLDGDNKFLFVACTRANCVWRLKILPDGTLTKGGVFVQLSGGFAGPDGLAINEEDGITIAHAGYGVVWVCNRLGDPVIAVKAPNDMIYTTNIAYGGPDRRDLYITESYSGVILKARVDVPGRAMYSHQ